MSRSKGLGYLGGNGRSEIAHPGGVGIEHRQMIAGIFRRAVERPVRIDRGIALVGRNQIVEILLLVAPIPGRHDNVAFDALRPRRLGERQFALGNAIGPVAEIFERNAAKLAGQRIDHQCRGLSGLHAPDPGLFAALEFAKRARNRSRRELTKLMTTDA